MGLILDSSILIADERGKFDMPGFLRQFSSQPPLITAITASELLHGVERAADANRKARRHFPGNCSPCGFAFRRTTGHGAQAEPDGVRAISAQCHYRRRPDPSSGHAAPAAAYWATTAFFAGSALLQGNPGKFCRSAPACRIRRSSGKRKPRVASLRRIRKETIALAILVEELRGSPQRYHRPHGRGPDSAPTSRKLELRRGKRPTPFATPCWSTADHFHYGFAADWP